MTDTTDALTAAALEECEKIAKGLGHDGTAVMIRSLRRPT